MSLKTLCRLCLSPYQSNYKELISTNGGYSEAYNIASKYFDPMLLMVGNDHPPAILCLICWQHIQDFYTFQQTVYEAQSKLEEDKDGVSAVKLELEHIEDKISISTNIIFDKKLKNEADISAIECVALEEDDSFSSEDDRPLMERFFKPEKEKTFTKQKYKDKGNNRKNPARCRKRKYLDDDSSLMKANVLNTNDNVDTSKVSDKRDSQPKTLENDAFISEWRSELECVKCNAKFPNFTLLRKHFVKEHPDEKCYIVCCDRKFRSRYHIVEHIKLHMNPNVYRCDVCGKCSTNSRNLAQHIKELHSEESKQRSLECPKCLKILANKNSLRVHMETHETNLIYICQECGKAFPSEQKRTLHERYVHNATLICDQCGKNLHNHYAMKQHLLQHAGIQKRKWPCDCCSVQLNSRSSLKRHKQLIHQEHSTVYVCSDCGKVATTEVALLTHKRNVHLSIRKHKCTLCDKAFKFPRALREHIATHTGVDLYQCPHCEKTFKTNANMHHHRKKVHPREWAEGQLNKPQIKKVDYSCVQKEIII